MVYLARHGETAWSLSGQHTGVTNLPLTQGGERNALRLGERLKALSFAKVLTSSLQRATRTCELAGFGSFAQIDRELLEWNYGEYEGRTTKEIHDLIGNCSSTAVLAVNPPIRLARAQIECWNGCAPSMVTFCFFPVVISYACLLPDGLGWTRRREDISF